MPNVNKETLVVALAGLEVMRERLDRQIDFLRSELGSSQGSGSQPSSADVVQQRLGSAQPKRQMSAAGRKRIAEAARRRWAALKDEAKPASAARAATSTAPAPTTKKRRISAAGLKRIAEAQKKRWAAKRRANVSAK